jgi:hypothetical protein
VRPVIDALAGFLFVMALISIALQLYEWIFPG